MAERPNTTQDRDNPALLGVVAIDAERGVRLVEVISGSAAQGANLRVGDLLLRLDDKPLEDPSHLDALLAAYEPGDEVSYQLLRGRDRVHPGKLHPGKLTPGKLTPGKLTPGKLTLGKLTLGDRSSLRSGGLQRRKPGKTGFEAPEWYGWAWSNLDKEEEAPSRANTAGRVVVIHAFQSW